MRLNKLDLNLLIALDVLLKEQSISKAAEVLNLSPSAISNSLSRLREYFDDDILTQVGRQMILTSLGENLQEPVRNVLNMIESNIMVQPTFDPKTTDRIFTIFCSDYTQRVLMPHLLSLISQQKSSARFKFWQQVTNPHKPMEGGEADFQIIPEQFVARSQPYTVLYEEEFVCMAWEKSRIAQNPLTIKAYREANHITAEPNHVSQDYFSCMLRSDLDINRKVVASTYSFATLPSLVIGTENLVTVQRRLALALAHHNPVKILPLPFDIPPMKQCLQWHNYRDKDRGLIWLREMFIQATSRMCNTVND